MRATWLVVRTFAGKDLRVALSYRMSFILTQFSALSTLLVFYFVAQVIGTGGEFASPEEYFSFVVVGIALADVMQSAAGAAAANVRRDQTEGTLEILAAEPVSIGALGIAWSAYPVLDGFIRGVATLLLGLLLGFSAAATDWAAVAVVLAMTSVLFLSVGLLGASVVLAFQQGAGLTSLILGMLGLVSGALFPVSVLPPWLQTISELSPLTYALNAMRGAALEGQSVAELSDELLVLAGYTVVLIPASVLLLSHAMRYARRRGSLARF